MNRRLFLALTFFWLASCRQPPVTFRNTDLTGATFGRKLVLTDHNGQPVSLVDFQGRVVIVFFGYTSCPDICPTMLARLAEVMKALGPASKNVQVLFVTLDPERDTAARLKAFVPWFYPSFLGLHGDAAQIKAVTEEFRVFSARKNVDSDLGYVLDHSSGAYVYDPAGRLRLYVKDGASVEEIAADIGQLLGGH